METVVVATGRVSRIACERFIPGTVEPIDNSRVLIESQPLGQYYQFLLAQCWQFHPLKQRPNYFSIMVLFRPECCVPPSFFSFSSICSWFDLKSGEKEVEKGLATRERRKVYRKKWDLKNWRGGGRKDPLPRVLTTLYGKGSLPFFSSLWPIKIM